MRTAAKKRFGQHFLRDTGILDRIVRFIGPRPGDVCVEIGAGDGALTQRLAPKTSRLLAVEVDRDCLPLLRRNLAAFSNVTILNEDILRMDLAEVVKPLLGQGLRLRIAGNLPYNIATAIIERLLRGHLPAEDMTFMLQLEVAERLTAAPGSRRYGYISVMCGHLADVEIAFKVAPACFVPRPKVQSALVVLRPRPAGKDPDVEEALSEVTKAAFSHRRKTLANSLKHHGRFGPDAERLLQAAGIDGSRRAEDLDIEEYVRLAVCARRLES